MQERRPVMLAILDGWGWREDPADNAVRREHAHVGTDARRCALADRDRPELGRRRSGNHFGR